MLRRVSSPPDAALRRPRSRSFQAAALLLTVCFPASGHALPLLPDFSATYGSGAFGTWTVDASGMLAYSYDHGAAAARQTFTAQPPYHMLGNSGSLLHTYADGYDVLFTSRTFPRYANYFRPARQAWSGGFGWVLDRTRGELWSTFYPDTPEPATYGTTWGMGYAKRSVSHGGVTVETHSFAPPGDDEVVIQKITITNTSQTHKKLSYYAYWDWDPYLLQSLSSPPNHTPYYEPDLFWLAHDPARAALKATSTAGDGNLLLPHGVTDPSAKTAFFSLLSGPLDGYEMVKSRVFSRAQRRPLPDAMNRTALTNSRSLLLPYTSGDMLFVSESRLTLAPGASTTLYTLYGLARKGAENAVIDRYRADPQGRLAEVVARQRAQLVKFRAPHAADAWLSREVAWSSSYLRAGVTREDWFGADAHTLNQGSSYLLDAGQNIAPRDNVQHLVPMIYVEPRLAREMLRYVLRSMYPSGQLPFGTAGYGAAATASLYLTPSDLGLWLAWGVAEYVNATRDYGFLDEVNPHFHALQRDTAYQMLKKAVTYQLNVVGTGAHGLVRIMNSDWADGLTAQAEDPIATALFGESTANTALAIWVYPMVADLARRKGDLAFARRLDDATEGLRSAMLAQWKGDMFNRAYLYGPGLDSFELGADLFWAESNAFALLPEQKLLTAAQVDRLVAKISDPASGASTPLGLNISGKARPGYALPGRLTVGDTTWYSLSGALVRGLAGYAEISAAARSFGYAELKRSTLANHATLYPSWFYGIISGSDCSYTNLNDLGLGHVAGACWLESLLANGDLNHPINNMHSHAQLVYSTLRLVGVRPTKDGYVIRPAMPTDDGFGWESPSFGVQYDPLAITGKITALGSDTISLEIELTDELAATASLTVARDGSAIAYTRPAPDTIQFRLQVRASDEVRWSIRPQ